MISDEDGQELLPTPRDWTHTEITHANKSHGQKNRRNRVDILRRRFTTMLRFAKSGMNIAKEKTGAGF